MRTSIEHEESDSQSSSEIHGYAQGEMLARVTQIISGIGKGVSLLNINSDIDCQVELNDQKGVEDYYQEAKESNLVNRRDSGILSEAPLLFNCNNDDYSLSDASPFSLPNGDNGDENVSCDNTGGVDQLVCEEDIDRLQIEVETSYRRVSSALSLTSIQSYYESELVKDARASLSQPQGTAIRRQNTHESTSNVKLSDHTSQGLERSGPLSFFRGIAGLSSKSLSENEDADGKCRAGKKIPLRSSSLNTKTDTNMTHSRRRSASWRPGDLISRSLKQSLESEASTDDSTTAEAKQRATAKLMHKHFHTANNPDSFRELQKRMKEKGAVTGTSVRALLQEIDPLDSDDGTEHALEIELDDSVKQKFSKVTDLSAAPFELRREFSQESVVNHKQPLKDEHRLRSDPIFGNVDLRPYIHLPSRELTFRSMTDIITCSADEGRPSLLTVRGDRYIGKSKLVDSAIDNIQQQSMSAFTILKSQRSSTNQSFSFYPFREIVSSGLIECERKTRPVGDHEGVDNKSNLTLVKRLVQRKVIDKSDQLMLGRLLPDVMLGSCDLLSLLQGRSPAALTKDTTTALFKIFIPLQPVVLVFDNNGDGNQIDPSSLALIEKLLLSASGNCPQLISIILSREPLPIPRSILDIMVDICLVNITVEDAEKYIRALFCNPGCIDENMTVDENLLHSIYSTSKGCPLFLERLVLWTQDRAIIELDERRNAVSINYSQGQFSDLADVLPASLYEVILTEISGLPDNQLEALKLACCMGMTFSFSTYEALESEGFFELIQSLNASIRIFDVTDDGCFKWRYPVVFDAVQSIIISDEAKEIHEHICDSLGRTSLVNSSDARYAWHYSMAGRWDKAWDQYMDLGKLSEKMHNYSDSVTFYIKAQSLQGRASLRERIACSTALGWSLRALERFDEAERELESSLEATMDLPENDREEEYYLLTALAMLKSAQSKYGEAVKLYERALPIASKKTHSPKWLAHHISTYGEILRKSGELERAKELHQEALKYRELAVTLKSCTTLELSSSYTHLGCTFAALGDHKTSFYFHKKALSARADLDFYHSLVSESLNYCADSLQALGKGNEALPLALHAVKIRKQLFGSSHPAYAHALSVLASVYYSIGRPFDSVELLKECLDICDVAFSSTHSNLIPNLMLYGNVLRVSGETLEAISVYKRALSIHLLNFNSNQNENQLKELNRCLDELESSLACRPIASFDMPVPPMERDPGKVHLIMCADFGHRPSDDYAISVASSLSQMGSMQLISFIATGEPQPESAYLARSTLDSLLLSYVPVAYSCVVPFTDEGSTNTCPHVNIDGVEMMTRALTQASISKSLTIMCTSCLGDIAEVIERHPGLFAQKVKEVVILGPTQPLRRKCNIEPEPSGNDECDRFSKKVYAFCQQLNVPTITMSKDIAKGFPFPSTYVDDLARTNHLVSLKVQRREEMSTYGLWEKGTKESRNHIFGSTRPEVGHYNLWPLVKSINIELVLGLLCCIPMYRDNHFRWESHRVNGIRHRISRYHTARAGIIESNSLSNEILMLIGFAFRSALLNTSC